MHTSVIAFVDTRHENIESMIERYAFEPSESEYLEFEVHRTPEEAKAQYESDIKDLQRWRNRIADWRKAKKMSLEEYFNIYEGCIADDDGNLGYMSNPDGRWDWYTIGGRWADSIVLKDGSKADYAPIKEIDWQTIRREITEYIADSYDKIKAGERGFINDIKEGETKEEYIKRKDRGMITHYWNVLDSDGWVETDGENGNQTMQEYIDMHSSNEHIEVYILDCHS